MREFSVQVFDEFIPSTDISMYTSSRFDRLLGRLCQVAISYVADNVVNAPWLQVQQEHSMDGVNWVNKNSVGEVNYNDLSTTPVGWGYDPGTTPSLGLVRLRIFLSNRPGSCHLVLHVTER